MVASKYTKNYPFHGRTLTLLQHLDTAKILQGRSPLASLSIALNSDVMAILYKYYMWAVGCKTR